MKKSLVIATISLLTMGSASVLASDLTIPNTFVQGTPAVAADVNANFDAVEAAINNKAPIIHGHAGEDITSGTVDEARIDQDIARDSEIMPKVLSIDGPGSTLNADTLDNLDSTNFALSGHNHSGADITIGTVADPRIADTIARDNEVVDIVNDATNVDADTLGGNLPSNFATAGHTHNITTITGTIDADTLNGQTASAFAPASTTDDLNDRVTAIENGTTGCPSDMVKVGPICVDKYEASLWDSATGGTPIDATTCLETGNNCSAKDNTGAANTAAIYARSVPGETPSSSITWFQAQQACANVGKRLLTNAEWQMAAAGTPDPASLGSDPINYCNTYTAGKVVTGATNTLTATQKCVSNWGVYDMVGNVNEWVAEWIQGRYDLSAPTGSNSPTYGSDSSNGVQPAGNQGNGATFLATIYRGGSYNASSNGVTAGVFSFSSAAAPSYQNANIGFRCAR